MQLLIVDVDLAHLGLHALSGLLLERLILLLVFDGVSLVGDSGVGDVGWIKKDGEGR